MADQDDARPGRHVPVVGHVDEQLVGDHLVLDPGVEHRQERFQVNRFGLIDEELYIEVL